jgi:hypothetical protein
MYDPESIPVLGERDACRRCGHSRWDHESGGICQECESGHFTSACGLFALYGFADATADVADWNAVPA